MSACASHFCLSPAPTRAPIPWPQSQWPIYPFCQSSAKFFPFFFLPLLLFLTDCGRSANRTAATEEAVLTPLVLGAVVVLVLLLLSPWWLGEVLRLLRRRLHPGASALILGLDELIQAAREYFSREERRERQRRAALYQHIRANDLRVVLSVVSPLTW